MVLTDQQGSLVSILSIDSIHRTDYIPCTPLDYFNQLMFAKRRPFKDAFGLLNRFYSINYNNNASLPIDLFNKPCFYKFEYLVDQRINQLIKQYNHITILASGGCDSNTIVASLIRNNIDKTKYTILVTDRSYKESPRFFDFCFKQKLPIKQIGNISIYDYLNTDCTNTHYINGCPEQIFQFPVMAKPLNQWLWIDWRDGIYNRLKSVTDIDKRSIDNIITILEWWIDQLNINIWNTIDLCWLYVFSGMWEYAPNMFPSSLKITSQYINHYSCFYKTDQFAQWAATNSLHHYPINNWFKGKNIKYRQHQKRYIATVFDDMEIWQKTKIGSQTDEHVLFPNSQSNDIAIYYDRNKLIRIPRQYQSTVYNIIRKPLFVDNEI